MADIQEIIQAKYGIDISKENICKLYKIDNCNLSPDELQEKIEATRKRWNQSINGANEKNAQRDRARLENADKYEAILRDEGLRKGLDSYYKGGGSSEGDSANISFAREFFELVATTKKLRKKDIEFFFEYFQAERKNKKAILEMLSKEFKVLGLGNENNYANEDDTQEEEKKGKKKSEILIVNLFEESTLIKIKKCDELYHKCKQSRVLSMRYPTLRDGGLSEFLEMKNFHNIQEFKTAMNQKSKEVYAIRQEKGTEYVPLVDLFNSLQVLCESKDVIDNFTEFNLLLKYPELTPYMYLFTEVKPSTIKGLLAVANQHYAFRDEADFILSYFKPIYDNFGISDNGIAAIIKKAQKKAKANKVLNGIDEKLGRDKNFKIPIWVNLIHWLVYFPIFAAYFVFEIFKGIFTQLHLFAIPTFLITIAAEFWLFPEKVGVENLFILRKLINTSEWYDYLQGFLHISIGNWFEALLASLFAIGVILLVYSILPIFLFGFISITAEDLNKRFDWIGIERTFEYILMILHDKTEEQYRKKTKLFLKDKLLKIVVNMLCIAVTGALIYFAPIGFRLFSEKTGYFQKVAVAAEPVLETMIESEEAETTEEATEPEVLVEINVANANMRQGAGTDYAIVAGAVSGDTFVATGNQEPAANGSIWYEVYVDEEKTTTAWVSEKVSEIKE